KSRRLTAPYPVSSAQGISSPPKASVLGQLRESAAGQMGQEQRLVGQTVVAVAGTWGMIGLALFDRQVRQRHSEVPVRAGHGVEDAGEVLGAGQRIGLANRPLLPEEIGEGG